MSEIALESNRLKQIESELVTTWNGIEDTISHVRTLSNTAIIGAWRAGQLLLEAKKLLGHGNFGLWQTKMDLPHETARRYMQLAIHYATLDDLPENKREAYLAIGLLPDKDSIDHGVGNVTLATSKHPLQFVNRWNDWWSEVKIGKLKFDREQAKIDLKPLYEWMNKELYGK